MIRKIVNIDENKCNGCGACVSACHEGAIGMIDGKARLLRDDYCDGLGDCLPECPTDAITIIEREAEAYDEAAVQENMKKAKAAASAGCFGGCPGSAPSVIKPSAVCKPSSEASYGSELSNWPVQIKLAPVQAPYFDNANLLIAADCTAYAYANFHRDFIKGRVTLIGCPKLDNVDYSEKLTAIIKQNNIRSVTIVRMQVPCCGGLEMAARKALSGSGKLIPWQVVTVTNDGRILED